MSAAGFRGVFSLLLTPFLPDKTIDWTSYDRHVSWQIEQGPAGLFAVCGSSEMKWLDAEERLHRALVRTRTGWGNTSRGWSMPRPAARSCTSGRWFGRTW